MYVRSSFYRNKYSIKNFQQPFTQMYLLSHLILKIWRQIKIKTLLQKTIFLKQLWNAAFNLFIMPQIFTWINVYQLPHAWCPHTFETPPPSSTRALSPTYPSTVAESISALRRCRSVTFENVRIFRLLTNA